MWQVYEQMFRWDAFSMRISPMVLAVIVGMFIVHFSPKRWVSHCSDWLVSLPAVGKGVVTVGVAAVLMYVGTQQAAPFIYFQF
jgi:hypothetical protein